MSKFTAGASIAVFVFSAISIFSVAASADTITFSGPTMSDYDAPYTVFDTEVVWSYSSGVLTLQLLNETAPPDQYTLSDLCFNVSDDVTSIALLNNGGLTGTSLATNSHGGPFGVFDYKLDLGQGNNGVLGGNSATLTFLVSGSNLDSSDFFNGYSSGNNSELATIHFTRGPNGDSTWATPGESVPEPAGVTLLGLGVVGFLIRRFKNELA
jgi:hypothetical protein